MLGTKDYHGIVGLTVSSGSFTSSTGDCSMFGSYNEKKYHFLAYSMTQLRFDSARGRGEYVDAYAILSHCDQEARAYFPNLLQQNYIEIWGKDLDRGSIEVYESLERIIQSDPITKKGCGAKS